MTTDKQIHMVMRDMLFINWAVQPKCLRKLVPERLELDKKTDSDGQVIAFVSAVCFRVAEVRSSVLPLPRLSFDQVNYRAYVKAGEVPAVYFFDMKVNSRMVTALTSFLSAPVHYEDMNLMTEMVAGETGANTLRYIFASSGLQLEARVADRQAAASGNEAVSADFITHRLVGYASAGDSLFKIEVEHPRLDAVSAFVEYARSTKLEEVGLLTAGEAARPWSALYVREALFKTNPPTREG